MKNILKKNDGAALAMIIIVATVGLMLLTTILHLAYQNYKYSKATNKKSSAYYIADLGMEKTLKELETIVQSGKNFANQSVRNTLKTYTNPTNETVTAYEHFVKYGQIDVFRQDYETYYKDYLYNGSPKRLEIPNTAGFEPLTSSYSDLPEAQYKAVIDTTNFNANYMISISVVGNDNGKFERKIDANIGLNPWGYDSNGVAIIPNSNDININENAVYDSPQWARAVASSGDIIVRGGSTVTINGDIQVDGKRPTGSGIFKGTDYGGLIVGKYGQEGHLIVNGNIYSNNYIHTMSPNSTLDVNTSNASALDTIYTNDENATYLNGDPLSIGTLLLGGKQANDLANNQAKVFIDFINYLKDTYKVQKQYGGFAYADSIQIEKDADSSSINIDGSAIVYDNLSADGKGSITIGKNFYGFKYQGLTYDNSSSIAINDKDGVINLNGRVYSGSTAYVTTAGGTYQTAESISLFKNYYGYRIPISPYDDGASMKVYSPFTFLDLAPNDKLRHVFAYDNNISGNTISEGGMAYDKAMIKLNALYSVGNPLYDVTQLSNLNYDMGYTHGVLMGKNSSNNDFVGVINPSTTVLAPMKLSKGSLKDEAFWNYISDKYNTLMQIKALKADSGDRLTINQLVDNSVSFTYPAVYQSTDINYIVSDGDILVTSNASGTITISYNGTSTNYSSPFKGLILSTGGRIKVDSNNPVEIQGAIISLKDPSSLDPIGIEFAGSGNKTITYDKGILISIFKLPLSDAQDIKQYLTSQRGIEKMFNEAYNNSWVTGFKSGFDAYKGSKTQVDAMKSLADLYMLPDDKTLLSSGIINTSVAYGSRNYKVFKWHTTK